MPKLKNIVGILCFVCMLSGCAATLEGLKEDLGKVSDKAGLKKDNSASLVEGAAEAEETEASILVQIQTILKDQGYYKGKVDGKFSASTEAAIQDYQLDSGLRIDGRATPELLEALQSS